MQAVVDNNLVLVRLLHIHGADINRWDSLDIFLANIYNIYNIYAGRTVTPGARSTQPPPTVTTRSCPTCWRTARTGTR